MAFGNTTANITHAGNPPPLGNRPQLTVNKLTVSKRLKVNKPAFVNRLGLLL